MSQSCRVCTHSERLKIDKALLAGQSKSRISSVYGVPESSLAYHATHHLSRQLLKSHEMKQMLESKSLTTEIENLISRTKAILDKAEKQELHLVSLKAISELRQTFGFLVSTAFLLREDERAEAQEERRAEIDDLKSRYSVEELELLQLVLSKTADQRLIAVRIIDKDGPVPGQRKPLSLS